MKKLGKKIIADDGKLLVCHWDENCYGKEVSLGYIYYKNGEKLNSPHLLSEDEFYEVIEDEVEVIDNRCYDFRGETYAYIKTFIIKLRYSNDDQIAIILNNDEAKMAKMQEWREYASYIAKKYTEKP